jgi:hypothetical protein
MRRGSSLKAKKATPDRTSRRNYNYLFRFRASAPIASETPRLFLEEDWKDRAYNYRFHRFGRYAILLIRP